MYKYIIFDFDGTLADSGEIAVKAMNEMSEKHGFGPIKEEDIPKLRKMNVKERCRHVGVKPLMLPFLAGEYYGIYKKLMDDMELFEGMRELLEKLHGEGMGIAIISSNSESNIRHFLKTKGIGMIDKVICSNNVFNKDRIIKNFLKHNNLEKHQVVYVGDETRDIQACKKIGIKVIWVEWGLDIVENITKEQPDYTVSDPGEIYKIAKGGA